MARGQGWDVGARLAFSDPQDGQILIGVIQGLGSRARSYCIKASRRIGSRWTVRIEGRFQTDARREDIPFDLRRDNFVQVEVIFNFRAAETVPEDRMM